jgi:hypothetical protein
MADWERLRERNFFTITTKLKRNLLVRWLRRHRITANRILSLPEVTGIQNEETIYQIEKSDHRGYRYIEEDLGLVEESKDDDR